MSNISLRLVHDRPFAGPSDDLAFTLLFSFAGLMAQLAITGLGLVIRSL